MNKYKLLSILLFVFVFIGCEEVSPDVTVGGDGDTNLSSNQYSSISPPLEVTYLFNSTTEVEVDFNKFEGTTSIVSVEVTKRLFIADTSSVDTVVAPYVSDPVTYTVTGNTFSQTRAELFADVLVDGVLYTEDSLAAGDYWQLSYVVNLDSELPDGTTSYTNRSSTRIPFSCPLDAPFTGTYMLSYPEGGSPIGGTSYFGEVEVELTAPTAFDREMQVVYLPALGIGNGAVPFVFKLECERVLVADAQASGLGCGGTIFFGPAAEPSTYDPSDDSVIEVAFTEDPTNGCGGPIDGFVLLTKVEE